MWSFQLRELKLVTSFIFLGSEYIVVQRNPVIVKGPYLDLQLAKDKLKEIAKNGGIPEPGSTTGSRMMLEIIDGEIQVDPHFINGISQTPANGFDKYWADWSDIHLMVEIGKAWTWVTQGKNIV